MTASTGGRAGRWSRSTLDPLLNDGGDWCLLKPSAKFTGFAELIVASRQGR